MDYPTPRPELSRPPHPIIWMAAVAFVQIDKKEILLPLALLTGFYLRYRHEQKICKHEQYLLRVTPILRTREDKEWLTQAAKRTTWWFI